jgi:hypothetical protein
MSGYIVQLLCDISFCRVYSAAVLSVHRVHMWCERVLAWDGLGAYGRFMTVSMVLFGKFLRRG